MIANPAFDYTPVSDPEKVQKSVERIKRWSADCDRHAQKTAELAIKIGTELIATKEELPYGLWGHWLKGEFGWSERTAQRFMAIARRFTSDTVSDLSMAVLTLLAGDVPSEAVVEIIERSRNGEHVTKEHAREIIASHQPEQVTESNPSRKKKAIGIAKSKAETTPAEKNRIADEMEQTYGPVLAADRESEQQPEPTEQEIEQQILALAEKLSPEAKARVYGRLGECAGPDGKPLASAHDHAEKQPVVAENTVIVAPKPAFVSSAADVTLPPARGELIPFDPSDMKPPPSLDTPKFLEWWRKWVRYNIEAGRPLTQLEAEEQMALLVARRVESAISTIRQTIASRQFAFPKARETRPPFVPPTVEEVDEYIKERGITSFTGEGFVDHYKRDRWLLGNGNKMSDWKATVRDWQRRDEKRQKEKQQATVKGSAAVGGAYEIFKPTRRKSNDSGATASVRA